MTYANGEQYVGEWKDGSPIHEQRQVAEVNNSTANKYRKVNDYYVTFEDWDFLPPGEHLMDEIRDHFIQNRKAIEFKYKAVVDMTRIDEIETLGPSYAVVGKRGWLGYVTFGFQDNLKVVAECPIEGNAVYVFFERDWRKQMKHPKWWVKKIGRVWFRKVVH